MTRIEEGQVWENDNEYVEILGLSRWMASGLYVQYQSPKGKFEMHIDGFKKQYTLARGWE